MSHITPLLTLIALIKHSCSVKCYECESFTSSCNRGTCHGSACLRVEAAKNNFVSVRKGCTELWQQESCVEKDLLGLRAKRCICAKDYCNFDDVRFLLHVPNDYPEPVPSPKNSNAPYNDIANSDQKSAPTFHRASSGHRLRRPPSTIVHSKTDYLSYDETLYNYPDTGSSVYGPHSTGVGQNQHGSQISGTDTLPHGTKSDAGGGLKRDLGEGGTDDVTTNYVATIIFLCLFIGGAFILLVINTVCIHFC